MKFTELVGQVRSWFEHEQRVTYRTLQREFELDDETLAALKEELIEAKRVAVDEKGKVLVWIGTTEEDQGKRITDKGINGKTEAESEKGQWGNGEDSPVSSVGNSRTTGRNGEGVTRRNRTQPRTSDAGHRTVSRRAAAVDGAVL